MKSQLAILTLGILSAAGAFAQTGEMRGIVKDSSGAAIPRAKVELTNAGTKALRASQCDDHGEYSMAFLAPGDYSATVTADGFDTLVREGLKLEVGQRKSVDFEMKVGKTGQSVTVNGDIGQVNMSDASVSTVVDRNFVGNLPLSGRGFNALLQLTPGVVTAKTTTASQGQFSVNGQRTSSNYFSIDGVSANTGVSACSGLNQTAAGTIPTTSILGGMNALVSVDDLLEFRVQTSTFAPEYGRTPGAQISIVTRSGTNAFHGDIFDYFRNDQLDANNWFANQTGLLRPALRQNDFGGVIGGPVIHDRTFFFASYEGLRLRQPQTAVGYSVPSLASRQAAPANLQPYLNAFPLPNGPLQTSGFAADNATYSNPGTFDAGSLRIDHSLGRTLLFGRYAHSPSAQTSRGNLFPLNGITDVELGTSSVTLGATSILSPRVTNNARANWTRTEATNIVSMDGFGGAQPLSPGLLFPPYASLTDSAADLIISGGTGTSLMLGRNSDNLQKQLNFVDTASIARSNHLFQIGTDVRILRPSVGSPAYGVSLLFLGVGDPTKPLNQQSAGSFLSGSGLLESVSSRYPEFGLQFVNISNFFQDSWKLTTRMTLTYGLRWDIAPAPTATGGRTLLALTNVQTSAVAYAPAGKPLWNTDYKDIAPRLGLAVRMRDGDSPLVLRVGAGVFYDLTGGDLGNIPTGAPNVSTRTLPNNSFPFGPDTPAPPTLPAAAPYTNAFGMDPGFKTARAYEWNMALEQAIGSRGTVSVTYAGALGRDLYRTSLLNNPGPSFTSLYLGQSNARSSFHSLQLQYRGHIHRRVELLSSYTWGHSIDTASNDTVSSVPFTRINPASERGSSDFDARQSFSTALSVSAPRLSNAWLGPLVRDWALDGIIQGRTALPFDVTVSRDLGFGTFPFRPDLIPGKPVYIDDVNAGGGRRLDNTRLPGTPIQIGAFLIPTELRQGDLGRNAIRGFGMYQADLGLRREFALKERLRLQVKMECFNVLNHANFADPFGTIGTLNAAGTLSAQALFGRSRTMLAQSLGSGGATGGLSPLYQVGGPRSTQLSLKLLF